MQHFEVKPGPGDQILCDFCSAPNAPWVYQARSFVADEFTTRRGTKMVCTSEGKWAACDTCRSMIERRDIVALSRRSYDRFLHAHPEVVLFGTQEQLQEIRKGLYELHQQFMVHRL